MAIQISESELLEAITASQRTAEGQTVNEIADITGVERRRVLKALHEFRRQGRLTVRQGRRESISGRETSVPVYTIAPPKKRAKQ